MSEVHVDRSESPVKSALKRSVCMLGSCVPQHYKNWEPLHLIRPSCNGSHLPWCLGSQVPNIHYWSLNRDRNDTSEKASCGSSSQLASSQCGRSRGKDWQSKPRWIPEQKLKGGGLYKQAPCHEMLQPWKREVRRGFMLAGPCACTSQGCPREHVTALTGQACGHPGCNFFPDKIAGILF